MKVLILTDGCNWIVDRITDRIIAGMPDIEFLRADYTKIRTEELIDTANICDLVHYNNWDISYHLHRYQEIKTPFLYTVRSHRYPSYTYDVANWATKTMVINPMLLREIPNSVYVPDGIFEQFQPSKFVVGYAGLPNEYKGFHLIKQACEELGVEIKAATGYLKPEEMVDFYKSINLYVCASVAEGHSTPVMECLAMNIPVATLKVGLPSILNIHFIEERTVKSIKRTISKFYTSPQVLPIYSWENIIPQIKKLYNECVR